MPHRGSRTRPGVSTPGTSNERLANCLGLICCSHQEGQSLSFFKIVSENEIHCIGGVRFTRQTNALFSNRFRDILFAKSGGYVRIHNAKYLHFQQSGNAFVAIHHCCAISEKQRSAPVPDSRNGRQVGEPHGSLDVGPVEVMIAGYVGISCQLSVVSCQGEFETR